MHGEADAVAYPLGEIGSEVSAFGRRTRLGAWAGFALVAGAYFGANLLPLPARVALVVNQLAFLAPMAAAVIGGTWAHSRSTQTERRFWLLLTVANGVLLLGEAYYSAHMVFVDVRGPVIPSAFEYLNLTAAALFFALLVSMTRLSGMSILGRVRLGADTLGAVIATTAVVHAIAVRPLFEAHGVTNTALWLLAVAYPVIGLVMLGGTFSLIVGLKMSKWEPWEKLVALAIGIFSVGLVLWPLAAVAADRGSPAPLFDLAYLGGEYLLVMATVTRLTTPGVSRLRPLPPPTQLTDPDAGLAGLVVPAVMLAVMPYLLARALLAADGSVRIVFGAAATVTAVLLVTRTAAAAIDNARALERSSRDLLTGLGNHRHFHERLAAEVDLAARYGYPLCVVVADLDDFRSLNTLGGHQQGDRVLADVARHIRAAQRDTDVVCRIGGDEFGAILPEVTPEAARAACERVLESLRRRGAGGASVVTASIGLAVYPEDASDAEELMRHASGARYWAKQRGKDRVVRFDPLAVEPLDAEERIRGLEETSHLSTVAALAAAVDARDPLTQDHSRNVAALAVRFAAELGLDAKRVKLLETAALMHDIGKIGVSDDVLRKRGPLTPEERRDIEEHCTLGHTILASTSLQEILPWTLSHHERWDGGGYPAGIAGEAIPLEARVLAICDAYDSMTSKRPYHDPMDVTEALYEIDLCAGTQFDPSLADAFVAMVKRARSAG